MIKQEAKRSIRTIKTAVITGPTGAVGNALCRALLAEGIEVYAVCRPGSPRTADLPQDKALQLIDCDLSQAGALLTLPGLIPSGADAFFHLAWQGTTGAARNDMPLQTRNIETSLDAAQAAAALGCEVFVGAGSQAEYGRVDDRLCPDTPCRPETGYGMAKLCAGQMTRTTCAQSGVAHIWARILSVYGPYDGPNSMISSVISTLLAGRRPALTEGRQLWDYLYADDAAAAMLLMARHGADGAVYPLGSGTARPLRDYVAALRDAIGPTLPLGFGEVPYAEKQSMQLQADITALYRDTGFVPQTTFETGIRHTIAWMRTKNSHE